MIAFNSLLARQYSCEIWDILKLEKLICVQGAPQNITILRGSDTANLEQGYLFWISTDASIMKYFRSNLSCSYSEEIDTNVSRTLKLN